MSNNPNNPDNPGQGGGNGNPGQGGGNGPPGQGGRHPGRGPPPDSPAWDKAEGVPMRRRRELMDLPHVLGSGIGPRRSGSDKGQPAIIVFVDEKIPEEELEPTQRVPEEINGVPTDVVETGSISAEAASPGRHERLRPMTGGSSVGLAGSGGWGSSSALFEDDVGEHVILTNRHVAAVQDQDSTGEDFLQPSGPHSSTDTPIGTVKELGAWAPGGEASTDSAMIDVSTASTNDDMSVRMLGAGDLDGFEDAQVGERYVNNGAKTGLTSAELIAYDTMVTVEYGDPVWTTITYTEVLAFGNHTDNGDSGSLACRVDPDTGDCYAVGLHFAGSNTSSISIPIDAVQAEHGTFSPVTDAAYSTTQTEISGVAAYFEATPVVQETTSEGILPVLVANAGGQEGTQTPTLTSGTETFDEGALTLGHADYQVVNFEVSSLSSGEQSFTISTDDQSESFSAYVAETQTAEEGTDWSTLPNANPYTVKYDYVGVQDLGTSYEGYDDRPTEADADTVVSTVSELYTALGNVSAGETIWMQAGDYDVDGQSTRQDLPSNATLAGDGARILSPNGANGVFELTNDGARITGIRFEGNQETGTHSHQSIAILPRADVQIDNCEFYNWMTTAMYVGFGSSGQTTVEPTIRHNIIRDCRTDGNGYGVATYFDADPLIEYNFVNNCREGLASNGNDSASYRAENNLHGPDAMIFAFECHDPGGVRMRIHNNEIHLVERNDGTMIGRSYAQRGTPNDVADLQFNWFYNPNPPDPNDPGAAGTAISQTNHGSSDWVNVTWSNNHYGSSEPSDSSIGIEPLTDQSEPTEPTGPGPGVIQWAGTADWTSAPSRSGVVSSTFGDRDGDILQLGWDPNDPPLSTKAVNYFPLDEDTGPAVDAIGGDTGTLNGPQTGAPGVNRSSAMSFNGVDNQVLIDPTSALSSSGSFSIAAIIRPTDLSLAAQTIYRNGAQQDGVAFLSLRSNAIGFGFYGSGGSENWQLDSHSGAFTAGERYFVAGTFNASEDGGDNSLRTWVGTQSETNTVPDSYPGRAAGHTSYIGHQDVYGDRPFAGDIEEVLVCDGHLTSGEINGLNDALRDGSISLETKVLTPE